MRSYRFVLSACVALASVTFASAQAAPPGTSRQQSLDQLRQGATSKTELTLDHSMLVLAAKLDTNDEDLRRVIAGISGVSVHDFRYAPGASFDPQAIDALREDYREAGWKQLVNKSDKNGGASMTDLWVRFENNAISNVAVLVAKAAEVDLVEVKGSLSPLDIAHLCAHFGIPHIQGGIEVPNTSHR